MMYRGGHSFRVSISCLILIVLIQISGCATTPTGQQFSHSQQWHRNIEGNYVHVSGQILSEEQYARMAAEDVNGQLNRAAEKYPKKCKRRIQY